MDPLTRVPSAWAYDAGMSNGNTDAARLLAFAGSLRKGSFNKMLLNVAAEAARNAGAAVTVIDLADLPMPIYDGDLEARDGLPENAKKLKDLMHRHDGFLIASPEYNSSISGALKNAIDWASRQAPGEKPLACFTGKTAAIVAASPGALGGLRGLVHVRSILENINVLVIPDQIAIVKANEAFDEQGRLKDETQRKKVEAIGAKLATVTAKLKG